MQYTMSHSLLRLCMMVSILVFCLDWNRWLCGRCPLRATPPAQFRKEVNHPVVPRFFIARWSTSHTFGSQPHIVNQDPDGIELILQVLPILLLRGALIAPSVEGRVLRNREWVLQRGQEHGALELELLDVFSHLPRVYVVPNTFKPRRGDQTHAFDLVLQLGIHWVRT